MSEFRCKDSGGDIMNNELYNSFEQHLDDEPVSISDTGFSLDQIVDCNGNSFDEHYLYYNREKASNISKRDLRNHTWMMRDDNGRLPRTGIYSMPEELFGFDKKLPSEMAKSLNRKFGNVQYIQYGDYIYWIYCIRSIHIYDFKFIGTNMTRKMLHAILESNGYRMGYLHKSIDRKDVETWYHPDKLYLATFEIDQETNMLERKSVYYKKFEHRRMTYTDKTFALFDKRQFVNVPLIDEYGCDSLGWSKYVNCTSYLETTSYMKEGLTKQDFDFDKEYFDREYYDEMLVNCFNKE